MKKRRSGCRKDGTRYRGHVSISAHLYRDLLERSKQENLSMCQIVEQVVVAAMDREETPA